MSETLLAVDLGLKTGLACFGDDGKLIWYRSSNLGSRPRLKKAAKSVLREAENIRYLVIEGGGDLADPWIAEAKNLGIQVHLVSAHHWRKDLLLSREQRSGLDAKKHADTMARRIIEWSNAKRPTSLRHDAAEAICIGFWGGVTIGWLSVRDSRRVLDKKG